MRVAILQSSYIPWKGYFDIINSVDTFAFYDEAQFTKNDWRNRNILKKPDGAMWVTVPVKHNFGQKIIETQIADAMWWDRHLRTFKTYYARARHFDTVYPEIEQLYMQCKDESFLSRVNYILLKGICDLLRVKTRFVWSTDFNLKQGKSERLLDLCTKLNATEYLSGPSAREYLDTALFDRSGIRIQWMSYEGYPEYEQLFPPFSHQVSILDLLFNVGPAESGEYMLSFRRKKEYETA